MQHRFFFSLLFSLFFFSCDNHEEITQTKPTIFIPTKWTKGTGTIDDPYQIEIPEHLVYLSKTVNEAVPRTAEAQRFSNKYFKIMNDIDLNNILFIPIGNIYDLPFIGNLDGNFKKIINLKIKITNEHEPAGLFGSLNSRIKNLSIINGSIEGQNSVGGIAGEANANIENCSFEGNIIGKDGVGGIAGTGYLNINNCSFNGSIQGEAFIGGIVGDNIGSNGQIKNCFNKGTIRGTTMVGGIIGINYDSVIQECYNIGNITASKEIAGGIIGLSLGGRNLNIPNYINNCYNKGRILAQKYVAGITGKQDQGLIFNCYNTGEISKLSEEYSNPIAKGYDYVFNYVDNCYYLSSSIILDPNIVLVRGISKEKNYMTTVSFVNDLNNSILPNAWKQDKIPNINGGYPILSWQ
ncbi:GLUG motif-containing protein [Flavobacterium aquicola]|uniref:GLUG motif-containing protein n=1 Tax=Flavobacterium aquicola TaxID=1682742 RepID=A0A3E0EL33_9FLAO|nr:GLUG motif-containing protein [Flavobacterium aquicola]REG98433.1 GLUG motif-containing protein [Flavobacterium aquicola]